MTDECGTSAVVPSVFAQKLGPQQISNADQSPSESYRCSHAASIDRMEELLAWPRANVSQGSAQLAFLCLNQFDSAQFGPMKLNDVCATFLQKPD